MPDPKRLKVGDRIRFTSLPGEWSDPNYTVPASSRRFLKQLIARKWPSKVNKIEADGYPWISVKMKSRGKIIYHEWGIYESSGWRVVLKRKTKHE